MNRSSGQATPVIPRRILYYYYYYHYYYYRSLLCLIVFLLLLFLFARQQEEEMVRRQTRTYYVMPDLSSSSSSYSYEGGERSELIFFIPRHWSGRVMEAEVGLVRGDPCLLLDLEVGECLRLRSRTGPPLEVTVESIAVRARGRRAQVELSCVAPRPPYRW